MTLDNVVRIFTIVGGLAAVATLIKAVIEYIRQTTIKKFEKFEEMSKRFDDDKTIQDIILLLRSNSEELRNLDVSKKELFICFFEDVSFMVNSKIMNPDIAYYTFGFYAHLCVDNERFWANISKSEPFYRVFVDFCKQSRQFGLGRIQASDFCPRF